jgi:glycosyltransferase involved in cell wall biosynthesis
MSPPCISLVILARNRAHHLERLLDTFLAVNTHVPFELIIVDQGKTDNIDEVLSRYYKKTFIRLIKTGGKHSPAYLWNIGARKARYPFLLFLQDNVIYASDVLTAAVSQWNDPTVGAVGVRMDDDRESLPPGKEPCVLHTGVHFVWSEKRGYYQPEEVSHHSLEQYLSIKSDLSLPTSEPILPAVAGGFLLCRKFDFDSLNGFCEDYEYCLQDIDFCLRLRRDLDKSCRCVIKTSLQRVNKVAEAVRDGNLRADEGIEKDHQAFKEKWDNYIRRLMGKPTLDVPRILVKPESAPAGVPNVQIRPVSLNILFVLYGTIDSNGGLHVQLHADRLQCHGANCLIAVPTDDTLDKSIKSIDPRVLTFEKAEKHGVVFSDGRGPHIIHAWTPREIVRRFCEKMLQKYSCPLIIHLEDNEEYLTEVATGRPCGELKKLSREELDRIIPIGRYHPVYGRKFLDQAQGLTMIIDTLGRFNTKNVPSLVLPPPVDERLFYPRPLNLAFRRELGIPDGHVVLAYTGNVHEGNVLEVRELYSAVEILNQQGCPAVLLRTGLDGENLGVETWGRKYEKHMGWVERALVPDILAAADVLVQPGVSGPFNDQRIPSKLAEYFAMGRPVILPRANLGVKIEHGVQGITLEKADGKSIAQTIQWIRTDRDRAGKLAMGGVGFIQCGLGKSHSLDLIQFYDDGCKLGLFNH